MQAKAPFRHMPWALSDDRAPESSLSRDCLQQAQAVGYHLVTWWSINIFHTHEEQSGLLSLVSYCTLGRIPAELCLKISGR